MGLGEHLWRLWCCKNCRLRPTVTSSSIFFALQSSDMCLNFYLNYVAILGGTHICIGSIAAGTDAFTFRNILDFWDDRQMGIFPFGRRGLATLLTTTAGWLFFIRRFTAASTLFAFFT